MHILLDRFRQGGKYSALVASHQAELKREGKFTDQKSLSISSLQNHYLNLDISSGSGINNEKATLAQIKCTIFGNTKHSAKIYF